MPIICLHNTPAKYVKLPTYCAPDKDIIESTLMKKFSMTLNNNNNNFKQN